MHTHIPVKDKKKFLGWFLQSYSLKSRESVWILNYLLTHEKTLLHVHFVEEAHTSPRGMVVSTQGEGRVGFEFYKEGHLFLDPEQAFHDIRLNREQELYLELLFPHARQSEEYSAVLEDNPYHRWNDTIPTETLVRAEDGLAFFLLTQKKQALLGQIDEALEKNDRLTFLALAEEYTRIDAKKKARVANNAQK